jgi:transketolase
MSDFPLDEATLSDAPRQEPLRMGFGRGLYEAGRENDDVIALCADLTDSTQMSRFRDAFGDRFVEVGIAEQNLATVAAGMARAGKIPFTSSYAAFSPGRNWEQIKTTACLNDLPVKIVGSHAGLITGLDGATHQMLEDIALMRVLPGMVVVCPGDSVEAEKATVAIAGNGRPSYLRLARDATPIFTTPESPFEIGKAYVLRDGSDVTLAGTGTLTHALLRAAETLAARGIDAEVIHVPTVKPLDADTLLASVRKTGRIVTAEEAQCAGGFGSAVAELMSSVHPVPVLRCGVDDRYGETGRPAQLLAEFGLDSAGITRRVLAFLDRSEQ